MYALYSILLRMNCNDKFEERETNFQREDAEKGKGKNGIFEER